MRRHKRAAVAIAVALIGATVWALLRPARFKALDSGEILEVVVHGISSGREGDAEPVSRTDDPNDIALIVAVLRSARETSEHKCGPRGSITLRRPAAESVELDYLPGHNDGWYEFRHGGKIYRTSRPEFLAALKRIGIEAPLKAD